MYKKLIEKESEFLEKEMISWIWIEKGSIFQSFGLRKGIQF
jgi:hypothetical protein